MGEVYRAHDTTLGRDVAIKVIPQAFADDAERLARFTREAQTLAALNHPNIAHVHGLEDSDAGRALVMEFVDGEDLAQRLERGALPYREAIAIARQIARLRSGPVDRELRRDARGPLHHAAARLRRQHAAAGRGLDRDAAKDGRRRRREVIGLAAFASHGGCCANGRKVQRILWFLLYADRRLTDG